MVDFLKRKEMVSWSRYSEMFFSVLDSFECTLDRRKPLSPRRSNTAASVHPQHRNVVAVVSGGCSGRCAAKSARMAHQVALGVLVRLLRDLKMISYRKDLKEL